MFVVKLNISVNLCYWIIGNGKYGDLFICCIFNCGKVCWENIFVFVCKGIGKW